MSLPSLDGQRIAIIGGSSGIGYAVAECALAEGAQVVIASNAPSPSKKAATLASSLTFATPPLAPLPRRATAASTLAALLEAITTCAPSAKAHSATA